MQIFTHAHTYTHERELSRGNLNTSVTFSESRDLHQSCLEPCSRPRGSLPSPVIIASDDGDTRHTEMTGPRLSTRHALSYTSSFPTHTRSPPPHLPASPHPPPLPPSEF